jgi:TRAP-type mannitol/chloroaromatic compound transport system permease small subunit
VNLASNVLIESQWYLFSMTFLLGAPYALLHNEHVRVDVLYARMADRRKAWINILGTALFLLPFCVFIFYFSLTFVEASWRILEDSPDPGGIPRYPIKTLIPISMVLLFVQGVSELIKNVAMLTGRFPPHAQAVKQEGHAVVTDQAVHSDQETLFREDVKPDEQELPNPDEQQAREQPQQDGHNEQEEQQVQEKQP